MDFDFSQMTPEQRKAFESLMELGTMDEEQGALDEQMQQALALGQPSGYHHTTAGGAVLGGIGDILGAGSSNLKQQDLRKKQKELLDKKTALRKTYGGFLFGQGNQGASPSQWSQSPQAPDSLAASSPFGFGGGSPYGYVPGGY